MNSNAADFQVPISTQSFHSSALKALQLAAKANQSGADRERAQKIADRTALQIKDDAVRAAFIRLFDYIRQQHRMAEIGQVSEAPVKDLLLIGRFGMVRGAEFAATQLSDALQDIPLPDLLAVAPSVRFIESIAKKHKSISSTFLEMLSTEPVVVDRSAALDWMVKRSKPAELTKVASFLVSNRERLPHLSPYGRLLADALIRDKGGILLQTCLSLAKTDPVVVGRIRAALISDPKVMAQVLRIIPKLLASEHKTFILQFLEIWLPRYTSLPPRVRAPLSAQLGALCITFLKKSKRTAPQELVLDLLSRSLAEAIPMMKQSGDFEGFWVFARASDLVKSLGASTHVSQFGAGLVASSLEKAAAGISGESLLEALALNLGLVQLEKSGEQTAFNPEVHEDVNGGLLPNDPVVVRSSGWSLDGKPIRRATVVAL